MHRLVKTLRWVLPVVFILFVALLAVSYTRTPERRQATADPVAAERADDRPTIEANVFEDVQTLGGEVVSRIRAARTVGFESGWYMLEGVDLTIFRGNGREYTLAAPRAEFNAESREARAAGGVTIRSSDGLEIRTEKIDFDGSRMVNRIPATFSYQGWSGKAGGVDVRLADGEMTLFDGVEFRLDTPPPGEPPTSISSDRAVANRPAGTIAFSGRTVVHRGADRLSSNSVTVQMDQTGRLLTGLEGSGDVRVDLLGRDGISPSMGDGAKRISAAAFTTDLGPAGEIRGVTAMGGGRPVIATLDGPPMREIRANQMRLDFQGESPSRLHATGSVDLVERGAAPRRLRAGDAQVYFDLETRRPSAARLTGGVRMSEPGSLAESPSLLYDLGADTIVMDATTGATPRVTTGGHVLHAKRIEIAPKGSVVKASGSVVGRFVPGEGSLTASRSVVFPDADAPVHTNSDSLVMRQAGKVVWLNGDVRAWQGKNTLLASELQIQGEGELLQAKGNVRTVLYNTDGDGAAPQRMTTRSDSLKGSRGAGRIDLDGSVRIEDSARRIDSDAAVIHLDGEQRIEKVDATGKVVLTDRAAGRTARSSSASYSLGAKTVRLEGAPAVVSDPKGNIRGGTILLDLARNKVNVLKGDAPTEATYEPDTR